MKLQVRDISLAFGGIRALNDVSFSVRKGSISALIGPNGAGKTTMFNCITGFYKANRGSIRLFTEQGGEVDLGRIVGENYQLSDLGRPWRLAGKLYYRAFGGTHKVAQAGIARTFQNVRLFAEMSVIENLLVAQHKRLNRNLAAGILNSHAFRESEERALAEALYWLDFVGLRECGNRLAGELPYGLQRRIEIARALCMRPELICLDEPAAGLNPRETNELASTIQSIRDEHRITVLLIEHDMGLVMTIADEIIVLNYGQVIACGKPQEIQRDPRVLEAYLGIDT